MLHVDLQGLWDLYLDEKKEYSKPPKSNEIICLPDSTAHAGKGKANTKPNTSYMTENYHFEGYAWYSRQIEIAPEWVGKNIVLFLERTRISTVFIDGVEYDTLDSLCGFHEHNLTDKLTVGIHTLTPFLHRLFHFIMFFPTDIRRDFNFLRRFGIHLQIRRIYLFTYLKFHSSQNTIPIGLGIRGSHMSTLGRIISIIYKNG